MKQVFCLFCCIISFAGFSQSSVKGKSFHIGSRYNMFPDSARNTTPRSYDGKTYNAAEHYSDSSAYVFVPDYFDKNKPYQFVFWFHGWSNNIDTALAQFNLQQQFYDAHLNAVFIFPEGPKNAPDSYAGKFEKPDTFNYFMKDVNALLIKEKLIDKNSKAEMIYAGHSGAYRVMGYLLLHSSYPCKGILLFDALYAEQEKFAVYLQQHTTTRMINIYTNDGGTMQNSKGLAIDMKAWKWDFIVKEEDDFTKDDVIKHRIVFLHSNNKHNDVITYKNNFERFLEAVK